MPHAIRSFVIAAIPMIETSPSDTPMGTRMAISSSATPMPVTPISRLSIASPNGGVCGRTVGDRGLAGCYSARRSDSDLRAQARMARVAAPKPMGNAQRAGQM